MFAKHFKAKKKDIPILFIFVVLQRIYPPIHMNFFNLKKLFTIIIMLYGRKANGNEIFHFFHLFWFHVSSNSIILNEQKMRWIFLLHSVCVCVTIIHHCRRRHVDHNDNHNKHLKNEANEFDCFFFSGHLSSCSEWMKSSGLWFLLPEKKNKIITFFFAKFTL